MVLKTGNDNHSSEPVSDVFIEFSGVSKRYDRIQALDDVSFNINPGDIFGYIGPNGAGKTTTIKILVGLIRDFRGDIYINGNPISKNRNDIHKMLGYLPQESGFQEWRTVNHALQTFGRLSGLTSKHLETRIHDVLQLVNLSDELHTKIAHLSGGMTQKLRLAQALLHEPALLVLDEPMSGLDPTSRYQIKNIINNLAMSGVTIFFSSHILSDVQDIANRIGILNRGRIMKVGTPNDLQMQFQVGNAIHIVVAENSSLGQDLEDLDSVEYVEQSSSNSQIIHLTSKADLDASINEIFRSLLNQKCRIRKFNFIQPSLEDVYLKFVEGELS